MSKIRLNFAPNQNHRDTRPALVEVDWNTLLKTGSNKLRIKVKRLFTPDGVEIFQDTLQSFNLTDDDKLICSNGPDFGGRMKEAFAAQKKKEDAVVGLTDSHLSQIPSSSEVSSSSENCKECTVRLIAKDSLVEEEAVKQMNSTAKLPRMRLVIGLPDVHPGKGFPIGSASVSEDVFYPHLVGGDIGCGMSLYQTSIKAKKLKLDVWTESLRGLEQPWEGDVSEWLTNRKIGLTDHDHQTLGTIGGGNHFAELQTVHQILLPDVWNELGLDEEQLFLLVHSGSRAFGESVLRHHMDTFGPRGLLVESPEGKAYMESHDHALAWARANRALIAHRFMSCLTNDVINTACEDIDTDVTADGSVRKLDIWHNFVTKKAFASDFQSDDSGNKQSNQSTLNEGLTVGQSLWLHRKGAAPADKGPVIIPGSRGHYSYLVLPSSDNSDLERAAYSLAHGAGRKWNRGKALQMGKNSKHKASSFTTTELGSKVICENKDLLYEEVPAAYKEIEAIIEDLKSFKLISVIAVMKPLITYKTRVINYGK